MVEPTAYVYRALRPLTMTFEFSRTAIKRDELVYIKVSGSGGAYSRVSRDCGLNSPVNLDFYIENWESATKWGAFFELVDQVPYLITSTPLSVYRLKSLAPRKTPVISWFEGLFA